MRNQGKYVRTIVIWILFLSSTFSSAQEHSQQTPYAEGSKKLIEFENITTGAIMITPSYHNIYGGWETVNGLQVNRRFFTGLGIGEDFYDVDINNYYNPRYLPVFVNFRIAGRARIAPYLSLSLGYGFALSSTHNGVRWYYGGYNGLMLNPSVGVRFPIYHSLSYLLSFGFKHQSGLSINSLVIEAGLSI